MNKDNLFNEVSEVYKVREYKKKNSKNGQKSIQLPSSSIFNENEAIRVISNDDFNKIIDLFQELEKDNKNTENKLNQYQDYEEIKRELEILKEREIEYKQLQFKNQILEKDIERLTEKLEILEGNKEFVENNLNDISKELKETENKLKINETENTNKTIAINYYQGYINSLMSRGLYSRIINKEPVSKYEKPEYVKEIERNKEK